MHQLTRRNVIATLSGSAVLLCPKILTAQEIDLSAWNDIPTNVPIGQSSLVQLDAGPAEIDISTLQPGEVAVVARPTTNSDYERTDMIEYIGILRRTEAQIEFGAANDRAEMIKDPRYLVVDLLCPHRGKAVGITGDANRPFACTDRGGRHSSEFSASGEGVAGASEGEDWLSAPDYTLTVTEAGGAISKAVLNLS